MLGFNKRTLKALSIGFPNYSAADFEALLNVPTTVALEVMRDYSALLSGDPKNHAMTGIASGGRDGAAAMKILLPRYGLSRGQASRIALYFMNIATIKTQKKRWEQLGINEARWRWTTCGTRGDVHNEAHINADGKKFSAATGLLVGGIILIPGATISCTCTAQSIIPGFDDD